MRKHQISDLKILVFCLLQTPSLAFLFDFLYPETFTVTVSIVIDRGIDQVFEFCKDLQNDNVWRVDVEEIECLELCDAVQVGSKYKEVTDLGTIIPFLPTIDAFPAVVELDSTNYRIKWDGTERDYSVQRSFKVITEESTEFTALYFSTLKETLSLIIIPIPIPIITWIYSLGRNAEARQLKEYVESNL